MQGINEMTILEGFIAQMQHDQQQQQSSQKREYVKNNNNNNNQSNQTQNQPNITFNQQNKQQNVTFNQQNKQQNVTFNQALPNFLNKSQFKNQPHMTLIQIEERSENTKKVMVYMEEQCSQNQYKNRRWKNKCLINKTQMHLIFAACVVFLITIACASARK